MARSPSYPQFTLPKSLDLLKMLYNSAHRATVDSQTAIEAMGYSPRSGSGLAALSSLKQFDLIEGRDESISITKLGLTLLEPIDDEEYNAAYREAALSPNLFSELHALFGEGSPSESVLRSMAIRKYEFTSTGAEKLFRSYSGTIANIKEDKASFRRSGQGERNGAIQEMTRESRSESDERKDFQGEGQFANDFSAGGESDPVTKLQFPLSTQCTATVTFYGTVTTAVINKLIAHLQLSADIYSDDDK